MRFLSRFLGGDDVGKVYEHPGEVFVDPDVAERLPDPAKFLLSELAADFAPYLSRAEEMFNDARHANGSLPYATRPEVGYDPSAGPLFLLNRITSIENLTVVDVWSTYSLRGTAKNSMYNIAEDLK